MELCDEDGCWTGWADDDGFMIGDEYNNGQICDKDGNCMGVEYYGEYYEFFTISEWETIEYPVEIDWIEYYFVDTIQAWIGGFCEINDDEVLECDYYGETWTAGVDDFGFFFEDYTGRTECDWLGNCYDSEYGECFENWEEIDCEYSSVNLISCADCMSTMINFK